MRAFCWAAALLLGSLLCSGCGGQTTAGGAGGAGGGGGGTGGGQVGPCSIVSSGALPAPSGSGAYVTGPAITATTKGFVIAYREQVGATLTAKIVPLSDGGKLGTPDSLDLAGCDTAVPSDGVSVTFASSQGMMAASLPDCSGSGAGMVFAPFDTAGKVENPSGPKNGTFTELTTAPSSAVAPASSPGEYELVYRVVASNVPVIERVVLQGSTFKGNVVHPFADVDAPFALVSTSAEIRLLTSFDAQGSLELMVGPHDGDALDNLTTFTLPAASWAAQTAWSHRAMVVAPAGKTRLTYLAVELGSNLAATQLLTAAVDIGAAVGSAALTTLDDDLYLLTGSEQRLALYRATGATGTLQQFAPLVDFSATIGGQSLAGFDGSNVAIAAARGKVVLTWRTKLSLAAGDPTGGYAVLSCLH